MSEDSSTGTMSEFKYSRVDFLFTCLGLVFLLLDIALDVWAVVSLYEEKAYLSLGVLLLFLVGSSVLVQAFSWLWYSYEDFKRVTTVEKCVSVTQLKLLHWMQLGIYFRHAGVVEVSVCSYLKTLKCSEVRKPADNADVAHAPDDAGVANDRDKRDDEGFAVYLSHDLSMLRLIETFSESSPQLVLMLTIMLQRGELTPWTVLKAIGSASAIACSVTMYHRSLRSFLEDKEKQQVLSSVFYFLWNLLLVMSRITALALFASVLPCFIFTHFLCSWFILFFFVWRSKTDFMDNACGEWLYRATVGLIWYFDWFNVVEGKTRYKTLVYHGYILVDISLLCGLWCWKMITEPPYFEISPRYTIITAVGVVTAYMLGLFFKMIYYKFFHPNLKKSPTQREPSITGDVPDSARFMHAHTEISSDSETDVIEYRSARPPDTKRYNKRMRKLAENFYS